MEQQTISEDVESGKEKYKQLRKDYMSGDVTDEEYETRVSYLMDQYGEEIIDIDASPDTFFQRSINKITATVDSYSSYMYAIITIAIVATLFEVFSFPFILAATILAPVLPLILFGVLAYLVWL